MSGFRHPVFEDRIAATDVASVLQGIHPLYPHDWLKTRWIQHGGGFQLSKKASLPPGMRTSNANPRHTGTWLLTLKDATQTDVVAFDYISCNGKISWGKNVSHEIHLHSVFGFQLLLLLHFEWISKSWGERQFGFRLHLNLFFWESLKQKD